MRPGIRGLLPVAAAMTLASGAAGSAAAAVERGPSALRTVCRSENIRAFYRSQLLGELERTVGEAIVLADRKIAARVSERGQLQLDLKGDGSFSKTMYGSKGTVPVSMELDGKKSPFSVMLLFQKADDGKWTYRNATQLSVQLGGDAVVVIDANANGVYNEPGIDGMTWWGERYLFPLPGPGERFCTPKQELTGLELGPWGKEVKVTGRQLSTTTGAALEVLQGVNVERVKLGLTPRPENTGLSADLQKHCSYMSRNQQLTHGEDKGKPGYTPEGNASGLRSILCMGRPAALVAKGMVDTYFHRQDVIRPNAVGFGVGYEGRYGGIDGRSDLDKSIRVVWPVLCPAPEQEDVGILYNKESPDATPGDASAGWPITAYFGTGKLKLTSYSLKPLERGPRGPRPGASLDCYRYDPKTGANANMTGFQHCACIISKDPLATGTTYEVTLEVDVDGAPWKKTWRFTTGGGPSRRR